MASRTLALLPIALAAVMASGCASLRQQLGLAFVPTETEVQLGQELVAQIEHEQTLLKDSVVQSYISTVFAAVAQYAAQDRPEISYDAKVIDAPDQVNAFAVPGGHVYLYTGLLKAAENEAEVAGVMAHELGHLVARHSANQLGTQVGLSLLGSIALGQNPNELANLAAQLVSASTMASFSREDEEEADQYGLRYAAAAGYSPAGLESFFVKLQRLEGGSSGGVFEGLLASHPATQDRIDLLRRRIERGGYTGGKLEAARYQKIRARL
jgi:beta-barrel assembly-enhancing protease